MFWSNRNLTFSLFQVQAYAQVALQKMWLTCQRQNLREVMSDYAVIESCVNFLESSNEGLRQKVRVLGDFFFLDLHPYLDFSVQTLYEILPRLAEVTDEEWISPNGFMNGTLGMRVWKSHGDGFHRLKLINPDDTRLSKLLDAPRYNYEEGIGEQIMRRLTGKQFTRRMSFKAMTSCVDFRVVMYRRRSDHGK